MTKNAQRHNLIADASSGSTIEPTATGAPADANQAAAAPAVDGVAASSSSAPLSSSKSKQDTVIALMQREEGASLEELVAATGWQKHSVRGLISGALKKKLGLTVVTEKTAEGTVYRIAATAGETTDAV